MIMTNNNKLLPVEVDELTKNRIKIVSTLENKKEYIDYKSDMKDTEPNSWYIFLWAGVL